MSAPISIATGQQSRIFLGLTRYQWLVLFAAWLGWGFDVFDALLFNYVSRLCVPSLLGHGDAQTTARWTGIITSILLVGWSGGGVLFGHVADRLGRAKALMVTMLTYAFATAACAFAPNIYVLIAFRFIASLGIGGEWAAGASLVNETVPENRRVHAGALLYTAAPAGLFLATFMTDLFTHRIGVFASNPDMAWRAVFLTGLIPAAVALWVRSKVKESQEWKKKSRPPSIKFLFARKMRARTWGGLAMASVALIMWWSCNAFIPLIASLLVYELPKIPAGPELEALKASFVRICTCWFNLGGLIGTLLTVPIALMLGRRPMFLLYFLLSAVSIWGTYRLNMPPESRLFSAFFVGISVFGIFGSFTFYLPELFPVYLRATGAGFCYNIGRLITALGPLVVGEVARRSKASGDILEIVSWVALVPLVGVCMLLLGLGHETKPKDPTAG